MAPGLVPAEGQFSAACGPPGPTVLLHTASHLSITDFGTSGLFLKEEEGDMKLGKSC